MTNLIVLDTSFIISSIISNKDSQILKMAKTGKISLCYSDETFQELVETLKSKNIRKYIANNNAVAKFVAWYKYNAKEIIVTKEVKICRDPKDDKFIDLALSANADFIISNDKDLLVLESYNRVKILDPADFLKSLD
jgi:putative PIN family toxin of toxin-antitoxin system